MWLNQLEFLTRFAALIKHLFFMIWETALTYHQSLISNDLGSVRSKLLRYRIE